MRVEVETRLASVPRAEVDVERFVVARHAAGLLVSSIENKAWAAPQPNQARRHRAFVESTDAMWAYTIVLAPSEWLAGHSLATAGYHGTVPLENIEEWSTDHGHLFHAEVLAGACEQPKFTPAHDLLSWHEQVNAFLSQRFGLSLEPQQYLRTSNAGNAKPARWPSFARDTLAPIRGLPDPWLLIRPSSARHPTRVALDVATAPEEFIRSIERHTEGSAIAYRVTRPAARIPPRFPW